MTTDVDTLAQPSHRATESPRYDGSRSSGWGRPSVGMMRNAWWIS